MKPSTRFLSFVLAIVTVLIAVSIPVGVSAATTSTYKQQLLDAGFPESYAVRLEALHEKHPNWIFVPVMITDLKSTYTFSYCVNKENSPAERNLVTVSTWAPSPWTSLKGSNYTPYYDTDNTTLYDSGWRKASIEAIRYFMDPRNFLNDVDIFMFETLEFNAATQTVDRVEAALSGSFMGDGAKCDNGKTYAQYIWEVGKENNISPIFLASRLKQEQGVGTSPLVNGTLGTKLLEYYTNKPDTDGSSPVWGTVKKTDTFTESELLSYNGYYNFFNIGASGTGRFAIYLNGAKEAKSAGWNTKAKAIAGGAKKVAETYIGDYQETLYTQKFNVNPLSSRNFWGQYMQNISAPLTEGRNTRKTYNSEGILDEAFQFNIPVYGGMSDTPYADPANSISYYSPSVIVDVGENDGTIYKVRCGVYSVKSNATTLLNNLKNIYCEAFIEEKNSQYYVYAGSYAVQDNATTLSNRLTTLGYDSAIEQAAAPVEEQTYTVRYDANGGVGTMKDTVVVYGTSTALRANTFTRPGCTFLGWYRYRTSDNKWYYTNGSSNGWYVEGSQPDGYYKTVLKDKAKVSKTSPVDEDICIFYAVWEGNSYTVKFNANGGIGSMEDQAFNCANSTAINANTFTRVGYTFKGWSTKKTATTQMYSDKQTVSAITTEEDATVTLYAIWARNTYTIKYNANGGNGRMSDTKATYGVSASLLANTFTRAGYTFKGWNAYRSSDNTWYYTNGTISAWYVEDQQPDGYSKAVFKNKSVLPKMTPVNGDICIFYAIWG